LSRDHKPSLPDEKERILRLGGRIDTFRDEKGNPLGPERVWLPNQSIYCIIAEIQGLAMSRSLGDNVSKDVGVICNPELVKLQIEERDKFIVLASDGIWEFITSE
jgi:serine/threonine protein phosphatase PrpC